MKIMNILPKSVEKCIGEFIEKKLAENNVKYSYTSTLLGADDIFEQLQQKNCVIVYYPIQEKNNGFRLKNMQYLSGDNKEFVYINTAQTLEKQLFTAAHELGHIWEVDDYVRSQEEFKNLDSEHIITRFAAMLLMPSESFENAVFKEFYSLDEGDNAISFNEIMRILVVLMHKFFAPYKAVVMRLLELDILDKESAMILLGYSRIPSDLIELKRSKLIESLGYVELKTCTNKKWIDGLPSLLDKAEAIKGAPQAKIDYLRKAFGIESKVTCEEKEVFSLNTDNGEGDD